MDYIVGNPIGMGGFATVHKGVRKKDGMLVAMKFIYKNRIQKHVWSTAYGRFVPYEIHLLQKSSNIPGVVRVIDWHETKQHYTIVMERRESLISMQEYMDERGCLHEYEARCLTRQIVFTINNLMNMGVFHRDIKPGNILVDVETKETKIIDFGCGDVFRKGFYTVFSGTDIFMPPEWFRHGIYGAEQATVWSIGLVVLIMVTGVHPFETYDDIAACLLYKYVPQSLTHECKSFIFQCMACDPNRRCKLNELVFHQFLLC